MERPVFQPVGTPAEDLDTPALVVDVAAMDRNIEILHAYFRDAVAMVRPHVASHQCPQIAHRQMEAGGTSGGICVTTVGEAEVFSSSGFNDILVASQIVTRQKIRRLCALAESSVIDVAVDNGQNVDQLSEAAQALGVTLGVLVELDAGRGHCGVQPGSAALELARHVSRSAGLEFRGLLAFLPAPMPKKEDGGGTSFPNRAALEADTLRSLQPVLDARQAIEDDGQSVSTVSVAGTHCYDIAGSISGVTEVLAGSYPLMDYNSCQIRSEFTQAAKILAQVTSHPVENRAVLDAGHKATGPDLGVPVLEGYAGAVATRFSAEHGILELQNETTQQLNPGDKAWLLPVHLGLCLNQYDYIRAVRGGKLEGFWPMTGRGQFG